MIRYVSNRRTVLQALCLAAAALTVGGPVVAAESEADAWPTRSLRFVVPYAPGGPLDVTARMLAEKVREPLGQSVVIENKPGAGGNIGVDQVGRSPADGYTLVMGAVATFAINPWLFDNLPYDPVADFTPITLVASVPNVLVINPEFAEKQGIDNLSDLLNYAKANPGVLNFSSGGNGSAGHLAGELLNARAGIDAVHVPFAGAAPALSAVLGGQTHMIFDNLASAATLIESGKVKPLAVTTAERSGLLPDVPTVAESGLDGYDLGTWFGVFVPAGTPAQVVARLNAVYTDAMRSPEVRERLKAMGSEAEPMTSDAFADMVKREMAKYKEIVEISGAKL